MAAVPHPLSREWGGRSLPAWHAADRKGDAALWT